jgi:hypothetical protein
MRRTTLIFCLALLAAVACDGAASDQSLPTVPPRPSPQGAPRAFQMGISSLPPELTQESYQRTFALAASAGEMILIQRVPPWKEMLTGDLSDDTVESTQRETALAREHGLRIFIAIDPTDPALGRAQLAGLPQELRGAGFADEDVQRAFLGYARYVVENYEPDYLALGVEMNSYQRANPQDFERFVQLYHEAYRAVKEIAAETLVFPTFQLEELQGLLPVDNPQPAQWFLINRFEPDLDLLAVSTYPSTAFAGIDQLPESYFAQLSTYTRRPIAVAGTGYPSAASGANAASSEADQAAYVQRVLDAAQQLSMAFVVWFVSQDPTFTSEPPLDRLQPMGLFTQSGEGKPSWDVWRTAARRPLAATGTPTPAASPTPGP